jgi:antitoxin ParD1/3/4
MLDVNISLPEHMKAAIDEKIAASGYKDASEYLYHLICQDIVQEEIDDKALEKLLLEGLDSGASTLVTDEWWEQKRSQLLEKHQQPQK